jgi:hypothetical protein
MVELIGKHPLIDVKSSSDSSLDIDLDEESVNEGDVNEASARMQVICQFARESLLSYVKNDVNLSVFPGGIALPGDLFAPRLRTSQSPIHDDFSEDQSMEPPKKSTNVAPKQKKYAAASKRKTRSPAPPQDDDSVFGSDEELLSPKSPPSVDQDKDSVFGDGPSFSPPASPIGTQEFDNGLDVSPISHAQSPAKPVSRETKKRSSKAPKPSQKVEKKRKSIEVNTAVQEFPSPLSHEEEPSFLSSQETSKKSSGRRSKKSKPSPPTASSSTKLAKSSSSRKSKPTPVSIESSKAMVNITNNASNKSTSATKKRAVKKPACQSTDDEFDFPHSPPKMTAGRTRKSPSLSSDKSTPARKKRSSTKSKVGQSKKVVASPATTSPTELSPVVFSKTSRRKARARA